MDHHPSGGMLPPGASCEGHEMTATVLMFLRPSRDPRDKEGAYLVFPRNISFARLPALGEVVGLGNDQHGIAADYLVEVVHHCPQRPNGVDAEVYARRVDIVTVTSAAAGTPMEVKDRWKEGAWPSDSEDEWG
jgi:hypothetical protein